MADFETIRKKEADYHNRFYAETKLFQEGTWLARPIKAVMEVLELIAAPAISVLDLGCGVGRNAIPIAQRLLGTGGHVYGIDLLPIAVERLLYNANRYGVADTVSGSVADAEAFYIAPDTYDYIIASSCLEHLSSEQAFRRKLDELQAGTKADGINIILMNTDVVETDVAAGTSRRGAVELNMSHTQALSILKDAYASWEGLIELHVPQEIPENQYGKAIRFTSEWVSFAARKSKSSAELHMICNETQHIT